MGKNVNGDSIIVSDKYENSIYKLNPDGSINGHQADANVNDIFDGNFIDGECIM